MATGRPVGMRPGGDLSRSSSSQGLQLLPPFAWARALDPQCLPWLPACLLPPPQAHKYVQEFEYPLVREDVQHSAGDWVQDGQAVDSVLDEGIDSFKQTLKNGSNETRSNVGKTLHPRPSNRVPGSLHPSASQKYERIQN